MNDYVRTDTTEDFVATLEVAIEFLERADADDRYWKWFIYAIHSSVQSTLALVLDNGNGFLVQKPSVMKRMLEAHASGDAPINHHMDNFQRLVEKSFKRHNLRANAAPMEDDGHTDALSSLDELRDDFVHFNVKSWSIERLHIIQCSCKALSFIDYYVNNTHAILWYEDSHYLRARVAIKVLAAKLGDMSK